jgi:hypothetical protein
MLPVIYVPRDTPSVDPPGVLGVALTTILREDGSVQINFLHFDHHVFCSMQRL